MVSSSLSFYLTFYLASIRHRFWHSDKYSKNRSDILSHDVSCIFWHCIWHSVRVRHVYSCKVHIFLQMFSVQMWKTGDSQPLLCNLFRLHGFRHGRRQQIRHSPSPGGETIWLNRGSEHAMETWQREVTEHALAEWLPSGKLTVCYWKWWFIVDFPIENGGSFQFAM